MSNGLPELGTLRSRLLALGILVLVLGIVARFGVVPLWSEYRENAESIDEKRYQLARYELLGRGLAEREAQLAELVANDDAGQYTLSQASPALAAAELQERVKRLVAENEGQLKSIRVQAPGASGDFQRIGVTVSASLTNEALQRVLFALESAVPYLLVDNLVVSSRANRIQRQRRNRGRVPPPVKALDVTFDLTGMRRVTPES